MSFCSERKEFRTAGMGCWVRGEPDRSVFVCSGLKSSGMIHGVQARILRNVPS